MERQNKGGIKEVHPLQQHIEYSELINYLPHKDKMFLLSRVLQHDIYNHTITTEFDVKDSCIFYEEGLQGVPSWAGFEFLAQSISALTGVSNTIIGRRPLPGMILSVVDFKASVESFKKDTTIRMSIQEDFRDDDTHTYCYICSLFSPSTDKTPVVTSKITVMETEDIEKLFGK